MQQSPQWPWCSATTAETPKLAFNQSRFILRALFAACEHFVEQYFTSSKFLRHFARHSKGI
jgi:hypothetical protein